MNFSAVECLRLGVLLTLAGTLSSPAQAEVTGWLSWRGPEQSGVSRETGLPGKISAPGEALWTADFPGASTPVVADGRLYILGYVGTGTQLQEGLRCYDADNGRMLWEHLFSDYLSDIIYQRYATASPVIDAETGNVYMQGTQGILAAFTPDGRLLWSHAMMSEYGRLTFPNGRTASPVVDGNLVITRGITANWGANGPAGDRFYAFDKHTGDLVWTSTPAGRPKDNSYSSPYFTFLYGKRVFVATTGDGSVVCANASTGEPIWRVKLTKAGINATVLVHHNDTIIAIYGTPYEPGQIVAFKIPNASMLGGQAGPTEIERSQVELWSQDISTSTSSPILVDDRVYVVAEKGDLVSLDVPSGKILWTLKIGIEERNSCPLYADGKLYVPMLDDPAAKSEAANEAGTKGAFYIIDPSGDRPKTLTHLTLAGRCFGSPTAYNGKVYIQTKEKLYCFGKAGRNAGLPAPPSAPIWPKPGPATQLQIVPSEVLLRPGQTRSFHIRSLDANGFTVEDNIDPKSVKWAHYIPPTAKVRASMSGEFNANGQLVASSEATPSAGAFEATLGNLKGHIRGRILPAPPLRQDFESFKLSETTSSDAEPPTAFAYPPLPWIGARFKFDVRDQEGSKALVKTIDNIFFRRATVFIGSPDDHGYTMQADVMSEGNRRKMSDVGLINQRYVIVLKGNSQMLEINSNQELFRKQLAFRWSPNTWYTLKSRVDIAADGSGVVRAKVWPRGQSEPADWTLEAPHPIAHREGSPGLFGFSPQDMRIFIDNIAVTPN